MKALKILVVITAVVVIAGLTTQAWAACAPARVFRSVGAPVTNNIKISAVGSAQSGPNVIGRFWDSDDMNNSNNGLAGPNFGSLCPPSVWWLAAGVNWKIDGQQGGTGCGAAGCPATNMTVLVEDYDEAGAPGVDGSAFYMGWMVESTPASARWWDYGLVDGATAAATIPMLEFPNLIVTGSSRAGQSITVNYQNLDQTNNNHTWQASVGDVYPTADVIREWQLVKATGTSDPGRARALGWVTVQSTAYVPGGAPAVFNVPCSSIATDEYLAVGIGFEGGTGVIDSALVGSAIQIECDPNIAQPDLPTEMDRKPSATQLEGKAGRSGGRR